MNAQVKVNTDVSENNKNLSNTDVSEIENVFSNASDFRSIGEKITAPIDDIIARTAKVIDSDPIMNVSGELEKMNSEVQSVYKDILDSDSTFMKALKSLPLIGGIAKTIDGKIDEAKFNMKTIEGKIGIIFSGFDQAYTSINVSIDLQRQFIDGIDANLGKIIAYKKFIETKIQEFNERIKNTVDEDEKTKLTLFVQNVEFFNNNLNVLIGNLQLTKKRLEMRLDASMKLSMAMNSSRPIFKTLLSTAVIETSSQKALDASMKAMDIMAKTIDNMTSDLTDKAIESSKKAEEMSSKPVLSTKVFIENVEKLTTHFNNIESVRQKMAEQTKQDNKLFDEARAKLKDMKVLEKQDHDKLNSEIHGKK